MNVKSYWERVYKEKAPEQVSWFQPEANLSLRLIGDLEAPVTVPIIDVGGGASTLVDGLLSKGYKDLTVLDLSAAALGAAKTRLGARR